MCLNLVLSCLVGFLAIAMVVHISSSIIIAHFESENFPLCLTLGIILLVSFSSYCHRLFTSVVFIIIEDFERERFPLCLSFVLLSVVCDILLLIMQTLKRSRYTFGKFQTAKDDKQLKASGIFSFSLIYFFDIDFITNTNDLATAAAKNQDGVQQAQMGSLAPKSTDCRQDIAFLKFVKLCAGI